MPIVAYAALVASVSELREQARALIVALALTSQVPARGAITISGRQPESGAPRGPRDHDAAWWAAEFERVSTTGDTAELERFVEQLRDALDSILHRPIAAVGTIETIDDLDEQIIERGQGFDVVEVSVALRCLPRQVRRARLHAGRDAERGRQLVLDGAPHGVDLGMTLVRRGGMSIREAAAVAGVAKSTLHDATRRTA